MEKDDSGKKMKTYVARLCYDISQTNASETGKGYDKGYLAETILKCSPCSIKYVDRINDTKIKAIYKASTDEINITNGFKSYDEVFCTVVREYVHANIYSQLKNIELKHRDKEIKEGKINTSEKFTPSAYLSTPS